MIERLRLLRIPRNKEGTIKVRRQNLLLLISQIITPFDPRLFTTNHLESIVIRDSWKRGLDLLYVLPLSLEQSQLCARPFQQLPNNMAQHLLLNLHDPVQVNIGRLCFEMPVFCEMPARARLLRPERWSDSVDLPHSGYQRFSVQLPALGKVRLLIEIFHFKEGRAALNSC